MENETKLFSKPFERIIIPVDGSDLSMKAVKKGILFSKKFDISLLAICVIEQRKFLRLSSQNEYNKWNREVEEKAQQILNKVENLASKEDVDVKTMVVHGTSYEEIINEAKKNDLIVMGSKGQSSLDRILLGSVSEQVIHHADSAVLVIK